MASPHLDRFTPTRQPVPDLSKTLPREGSEDIDEPDPQKSVKVVYKLRDFNADMVEAWNTVFCEKPYFNTRIEVSRGDIFRGAPAADAIVSPANSFGFMDGGIDGVFSCHFGNEMSARLQRLIAGEMDGEMLVGNAVIIPTNVSGEEAPEIHPDVNDGQPIKWLISAPTMRVPLDISHTVNSYLAFKAVILAVKKFNNDPKNKEPIHSVLCPGLGTAVGKMPPIRCARQMLRAFETFDLKLHPLDVRPAELNDAWSLHCDMIQVED